MRTQFVISVAVAAVVTAWGWFAMPAGEIPVHFGAGGDADRWGSRTELTTVFAIIAGGCAVLMGAMAWWSSAMPWTMVNIPQRDKEFWQRPENDARGRARLRDDMFLVGAWVMWLLAVLKVFVVISVRSGEISGVLGAALVVVPLLMTLGLIVAMLKRSGFYSQRPDAG